MGPKGLPGEGGASSSGKHSLRENGTLLFNPGAGRLPPPEAMAAYAAIDPTYPQFLKEVFSAELKRNYRYQLFALVAGWSLGALLLSGSVFLAYTGHPRMAAAMIGANAIGLVSRMLTKAASRS